MHKYFAMTRNNETYRKCHIEGTPISNIMISKEKILIRFQHSLWKQIFIFDAASSYPFLDINSLMMQRSFIVFCNRLYWIKSINIDTYIGTHGWGNKLLQVRVTTTCLFQFFSLNTFWLFPYSTLDTFLLPLVKDYFLKPFGD